MLYYQIYQSPYAPILLTSDGEVLTGLWFWKENNFSALPEQAEKSEQAIFQEASRWLDLYFSGKNPDFTPQLRLTGTPFQETVWDILKDIPYGETVSYGEVSRLTAQKLGRERMSSQAVGGAVGRNPISLMVPCHRVVGSNGSLTGYGGGIEIKAKLLALEGVDMKKFFFPKRGTAL